MQIKKEERKRQESAYYSSSTKLWIPSFPAAILSDKATVTAGKPAVQAHREGNRLQECSRTDTETKRCSRAYPKISHDRCASYFQCCKLLQQGDKGRFPRRASNRKLPSESTAEELLLLHKHPVE